MTEYNFGNADTTNLITQEIPVGTVNGTNALFTLANTPLINSETVFVAGVSMSRSIDYTIVGSAITFLPGSIPQIGETISVSYLKSAIPLDLVGLNTKGDIVSSTGLAISTVSVGIDGQVLTADSSSVSGLSYQNSTGGVTKNSIINSDFSIWQRGISFPSPGYSADRWLVDYGNGAGVVSRTAFALGQTNVPDEPTYYLKLDQTTLSSIGTPSLVQRIEGVRTLAGKSVTVSFWAKANASLLNQKVFLNQDFGTVGTPSGTVIQQIDGGLFDLTTLWQKFVFTATLASLATKTLGTNGDDFLELEFQFDLNTVFTVDISHVQLEEGTSASQFVSINRSQELSRSQRYYYKTYNQDTLIGFNTDIGMRMFDVGTINDAFGNVDFPVTMRIPPTTTLYSKLGLLGASSDLADLDLSGTIASPVSESGIHKITRAGVQGFSGLDKVRAHLTAEAEL